MIVVVVGPLAFPFVEAAFSFVLVVVVVEPVDRNRRLVGLDIVLRQDLNAIDAR